MKQTSLALLSLLALACGSVKSGSVSAITGDADYDSTDKMRFEIEQTSSPMTFATDARTDISFRVTITNLDKEPITVKRLTLQSMAGSSYHLETSSRKFDTRIEPKGMQSFKYWAPAVANDTNLINARGPLVVRTTVEGTAGGMKIREVFNRRVNGQVSIGVGSLH